LILRIQPPYLDEVRLFESTASGWRERLAGDHHPSASRESADVAFNFAVKANAQNQGVFYLRLQTTSSSIIDIQALTPRDSAEQAADFERFMGINMGLVMGVLIWAVLQYFLLNRDQLVLRFIAYELITLLIALAMVGHLSDTVFADHPRWADTAFNALVAAGTTVLAWSLPPFGNTHTSALQSGAVAAAASPGTGGAAPRVWRRQRSRASMPAAGRRGGTGVFTTHPADSRLSSPATARPRAAGGIAASGLVRTQRPAAVQGTLSAAGDFVGPAS
jgi:hypothetical protein